MSDTPCTCWSMMLMSGFTDRNLLCSTNVISLLISNIILYIQYSLLTPLISLNFEAKFFVGVFSACSVKNV